MSWITWNPHPYGDNSSSSDSSNSALQNVLDGVITGAFGAFGSGHIPQQNSGSYFLDVIDGVNDWIQDHSIGQNLLNQAEDAATGAFGAIGKPGSHPSPKPGHVPGSGSWSGSGAVAAAASDESVEDPYQSIMDMITQTTQANNEWSAQQAQLNRDWQKMMSDTAHQREVADLQAAGLNPVLSATGGNGASTPSGAVAQGDTSNTRLLAEISLQALEAAQTNAAALGRLVNAQDTEAAQGLLGRLGSFLKDNGSYIGRVALSSATRWAVSHALKAVFL